MTSVTLGRAPESPADRTADRLMVRGGRVWRVLPLVALVATSGCFATRNDVRIVQSDVAALRTELVRNDAEHREALTQAIKLLAAATDSISRISTRTLGIQGDVRGEMRLVKEQLLQVQTLLGQSQSNINRIRAELEARNNAAPPAAPPVGTVPPATNPATSPVTAPVIPPATGSVPPADSAARGPGPAQLYSNGLDQLKRGSNSTARVIFQELLSNYPTSDLAPDAQAYIAQSLFREKNYAGADVAYAAVVTKYPESPKAPTSLFKRAQIAALQGNTTEARRLFTDVISKYPKSDEAVLAADELKRPR